MASFPILQKQLENCLSSTSNFKNANRVKSDVLQLFSSVHTLVPKIAPLPNDSSKRPTLCLDGTIPMFFQGAQYNIPVNIFLTEHYPAHPPVAFVTPTQNMIIKPRHTNVDGSGRCFLRYLTEWSQMTSNLNELVNQLSSIFSQEPPVYEKGAAKSTSPQPPTPAHQPPHNQPPHNQPPAPHTNMGTSYTVHPPPQGMWGQPPSMGYNYPPGSQYPPQPNPHNPYSRPSYGQPPTTYGQYNYMPPHGQPHTQPPYQQPMSHNPEQAKQMAKQNAIQQITSKLQSQLQQTMGKYSTELHQQAAAQAKEEAKATQLQSEIDSQTNAKAEYEKLLSIMDTKIEEITTWLQQNQDTEVDIDKAIEPKDVFSSQILELIAGDKAIEDMLYVLDKALQSGKLSLETYLQQVRQVSRDQFMKKALVKKIQIRMQTTQKR